MAVVLLTPQDTIQDYEHLAIEFDDEPVILSVNLVEGPGALHAGVKDEPDLEEVPGAASIEVRNLQIKSVASKHVS